jgi:hypothetical protein
MKNGREIHTESLRSMMLPVVFTVDKCLLNQRTGKTPIPFSSLTDLSTKMTETSLKLLMLAKLVIQTVTSDHTQELIMMLKDSLMLASILSFVSRPNKRCKN